jgi:hypothetical protein
MANKTTADRKRARSTVWHLDSKNTSTVNGNSVFSDLCQRTFVWSFNNFPLVILEIQICRQKKIQQKQNKKLNVTPAPVCFNCLVKNKNKTQGH